MTFPNMGPQDVIATLGPTARPAERITRSYGTVVMSLG